MEEHFHPDGSFMRRNGAAYSQGGARSNKKLCFVATDEALLMETLYELSLREDCYAVKYSPWNKDGMHLGRCILADDEAAGTVWKRLRRHPKLFCSVQDDEYIAPYRPADAYPPA